MDAPATPPPKCPFRPGDLRVVPAPRWGVARVAKAGGAAVDLAAGHQAGADAAARNKNRLTAYLSRLGDYVMTRCK